MRAVMMDTRWGVRTVVRKVKTLGMKMVES
jgi:hypothetical protein